MSNEETFLLTISGNNSETDGCSATPECAKQKKKNDKIIQRFSDVDRKAEKLYVSYRSNQVHIQAQIDKIKIAERIKRKFEMCLKANEEDMIALKLITHEIFNDMDAQRLPYMPERKKAALDALTLPPPPGK